MTSLDTLERWLAASVESEQLEFKEAKEHLEIVKLLHYCAAFPNEGGGHFGVSPEVP